MNDLTLSDLNNLGVKRTIPNKLYDLFAYILGGQEKLNDRGEEYKGAANAELSRLRAINSAEEKRKKALALHNLVLNNNLNPSDDLYKATGGGMIKWGNEDPVALSDALSSANAESTMNLKKALADKINGIQSSISGFTPNIHTPIKPVENKGWLEKTYDNSMIATPLRAIGALKQMLSKNRSAPVIPGSENPEKQLPQSMKNISPDQMQEQIQKIKALRAQGYNKEQIRQIMGI